MPNFCRFYIFNHTVRSILSDLEEELQLKLALVKIKNLKEKKGNYYYNFY